LSHSFAGPFTFEEGGKFRDYFILDILFGLASMDPGCEPRDLENVADGISAWGRNLAKGSVNGKAGS